MEEECGHAEHRHGEEALDAVFRQAARKQDLPSFLAALVQGTVAAEVAVGAAAWLVATGPTLDLVAVAGPGGEELARVADSPPARRALAERLALRLPADDEAGPALDLAALAGPGVGGLALLPVATESETYGLLALAWPHPPGEGDLRSLSRFAERASITVRLLQLLGTVRESEEKHRALMEGAMDAIFLVAVDSSRVVACNRKAEELTGRRRGELVGRVAWEIPGAAGGAALEELFRSAVARGELLARAVPLTRPDGTIIWMDLAAKVVRYGGREVLQAVARDVSEIYVLQERLKQYAAELERRVDEKTTELKRSQAYLVQSEKMAALGALVAGVAHEINTPVGSIASNVHTAGRCTERIRSALEDPAAAALKERHPELDKALRILDDTAAVSRDACERITGIVHNLRNFVRLDEGQLKEVDIHEGLESSIALVRHELKDRVRIVRDFGQVPPVECHPNQINQVFLNLLLNAAQAIEGEGEVHIRTSLQPPWVSIEFRDTGCGIAAELIDRIFEPGFTTKPAGIGSGLGLSIAQGIIQHHCGMLAVSSTLGQGSTFSVLLPAKKC